MDEIRGIAEQYRRRLQKPVFIKRQKRNPAKPNDVESPVGNADMAEGVYEENTIGLETNTQEYSFQPQEKTFSFNYDIQMVKDKTEYELIKLVKKMEGVDEKRFQYHAKEIATKSSELIQAIQEDDDKKILSLDKYDELLEVVQYTDGSRPSFIIQDDKVYQDSSPGNDWQELLTHSEESISCAIKCVGRINNRHQHIGTGFLIQENIIVTNHHVLEAISRLNPDNTRTIFPETTIGFGFEYRRAPGSIRLLKQPLFFGSHDFENTPNHSFLDLVLIEIEPLNDAPIYPVPFSIDKSPYWASDDQIVFAIGYPAAPGPMSQETLLNIFFFNQFGCKRLAPGRIDTETKIATWTASHDATTLGGSSGSAIIVANNEKVVAGIHYGGKRTTPNPSNWCHVFGATFDCLNAFSQDTLLSVIEMYQIQLFDQ